MKMTQFLMVAAAAVTMGCSDSGKGGPGPVNFDPTLKPANAAVKADVEYYMALLKLAEKVIPADEAVFSQVLDGSTVAHVTAEQRTEALAKLNSSGNNVIQSVLTNCTINEARSTSTVPEKVEVGAQGSEKGSMSITQSFTCPMLMSKQSETVTTIQAVDINEAKRSVYVKTALNMTETQVRDYPSAIIRENSNASKFNFKSTSVGSMEMTMTEQAVTVSANIKGQGSVAYDLADADFVRGPLSFEVTMNSATGKGEVKFLYDLKSSRGAVRIVAIGDETKQEIYINGEKTSPEHFPSVVNSLQSTFEKVPQMKSFMQSLVK